MLKKLNNGHTDQLRCNVLYMLATSPYSHAAPADVLQLAFSEAGEPMPIKNNKGAYNDIQQQAYQPA